MPRTGKVGTKAEIAKRDEVVAAKNGEKAAAEKPAKVEKPKTTHALKVGGDGRSLCGMLASSGYAVATDEVGCKQCAWTLGVLRDQAKAFAGYENLKFTDPRATAQPAAAQAV